MILTDYSLYADRAPWAASGRGGTLMAQWELD